MAESQPRIIQIDEDEVQAHGDRLAKPSVVEMLHGQKKY
jgi:hypothetical protein